MQLQIRVLCGSLVPEKLEADPNGTLLDFYKLLGTTGLISAETDARYRLVSAAAGRQRTPGSCGGWRHGAARPRTGGGLGWSCYAC